MGFLFGGTPAMPSVPAVPPPPPSSPGPQMVSGSANAVPGAAAAGGIAGQIIAPANTAQQSNVSGKTLLGA